MLVLVILFIAVGAGWLLRRYPLVHKISDSSGWTVFILLFVFGITIGLDKTLMAHFSTLGMRAFAIAAAGVVGSILTAILFARIVRRTKR